MTLHARIADNRWRAHASRAPTLPAPQPDPKRVAAAQTGRTGKPRASSDSSFCSRSPSLHDAPRAPVAAHLARLARARPLCHSAKLSSLVDVLFTPLALGRAITTSFLNPFRRAQAETASGQITIQVKWGRDRFNIPIPSPSTTPLSTLLATLSAQTSIPADQLKLIHKGAVLKDTSLTLSAYGVGDGASLVLVGKSGDAPGRAPAPAAAAPAAAPKKNRPPETDKEGVLVDWLRGFAAALLDPLQPPIATFVSHASPSATNRPAQAPSFDALQKEHARLSDTLIKGLLDLDGVNVPSGWTEARQARKDAVKRVQADMNRVDEAWGERKRLT